MRYAFVAEHRPLFPVRTMYRCLRIHPSGFYAWLNNPLSKRAKEDVRQTELIRKAWKESGKVYGYRKLHDDLLDQGETRCPNRVARLAKPNWQASRLRSATSADRAAMAASRHWSSTTHWTGSSMWTRPTGSGSPTSPIKDTGRLCLSGGRDLPLLSPRCRLVDAEPLDKRSGPAGIADGRLAQEAEEQCADPFGSGVSVHQHGLGVIPQGSQSGTTPSRRRVACLPGNG